MIKKDKINNTSYKLDLEKLKETDNLEKTIENVKKDINSKKETIVSSKNNKKENNKIKKQEKKETSKKDTKNKTQTKSNLNKTTHKTRTKRRKKKTKRIVLIAIILILLIVVTLMVIQTIKSINKQNEIIEAQQELKEEIVSHYNKYVTTNKEADIYKLNNSKYEKVGKIGKEQEIMLEETDVTYKDEYLKINTFEEEYYIYYKDIDIIEKLSEQSNRYKNYIVFNKNIITKDTTNFYDEENNLVYTLPLSFELPIIVNKKDIYGVEFNNRLLYVKKEDVSEIKDNKNTEEKPTKKVMTLAYHRIYDPKTEKCDQVICHKEEQFESHMKYLSDEKYLTLTTQELSDFIDGYIQIPKKSVVITIDDGTMVKRGIDILEKYKLNASLFIVTIRFKESDYTNTFNSDYVELHSHSHNMHWAGECAGYGTQGGGILCLPEERVLEDLKTSSDILGGSKVFCYPFYDYSTRAINLLKQAGYKMAFAGLLNTNGYTYVGTNKMLIPRATILSYTTFATFKAYVTY